MINVKTCLQNVNRYFAWLLICSSFFHVFSTQKRHRADDEVNGRKVLGG